MAAGDWHTFSDGYRFRETVNGPMVAGRCVDCGLTCGVMGDTERINNVGLREDVPTKTPRCSQCWRLHWGLDRAPTLATYLLRLGIPIEVLKLIGVA